MTDNQTKIYEAAKACLGTHVTLNNNVPPDVGCAEAVSYVLKKAGIQGIPTLGFPGTAGLYDWLSDNPHFLRVDVPEEGAILVSPTGHGNGKIEGHTGIIGAYGVQYKYEYGIMSNNSYNGLFEEVWSLDKWWEYYGIMGGLPLAIYRPL